MVGRLLCLQLCLLLLGNLSFAQQNCTLTLSGRVVDQDHDETLIGAYVMLVELNQPVLTDGDGSFRFTGLCPGSYTLRTGYLGYEEAVIQVSLDKNITRIIRLHHFDTALDVVEITADAISPVLAQPIETIKGRELQETRGEALGKVLEKLPGITSLQSGPVIYKPVIHGLYGNRVLLVQNGIRQEGQQWGQEHAPELDPFAVDELSVIKGASAVRYGSDAIAGVILAQPQPFGSIDKWEGQLYTGFASNGRLLSGGLRLGQHVTDTLPLYWRGHISGKRSGNMHTPGYYLDNTGQAEISSSLSAGWLGKRIGLEVYYSYYQGRVAILSASHIGNLTDLQRAINSERPSTEANFTYEIGRPYQALSHHLITAKGYYYIDSSSKLELQIGRQDNSRQEFDKHRPRNDSLAALNLPDMDLSLQTWTSELLLTHKWNNRRSSIIGLQAMMQEHRYSGRFFIPNYLTYSGGGFWIEKLKLKKWEAEAGVRYDVRQQQAFFWRNDSLRQPSANFHNLSGTAGLAYTPNHHLILKMHLGSAWRPPAMNELYSNGLHHGAASIEIGDSTLKKEQSYQATFTADYWYSTNFRTEISVYVNHMPSFIYLTPLGEPQLTIRGAFPAFAYRQTNALLAGVDGFVQWRFLPFAELTGKFMLLHAQDLDKDRPLILMPPNQATLNLSLTPSINLTSIEETYFSIGVRGIARQNRVPHGIDYLSPPPGYVLLDLNAGTTLRHWKQPVIIQLGVTNLLNTTYRSYLNRFRYFADEPGRSLNVRLFLPLGTTAAQKMTKSHP